MKQPSKNRNATFQIKEPDMPVRWGRLDALLLGILLLVYGILSFVNLGDRTAPQTYIRHGKNDQIIVTLAQPEDVAKLNFFRGQTITDYNISYSDDGQAWQNVSVQKNTNVFQWVSVAVNARAQYIKMIPLENNKAYLYEVGLFDENDKPIKIASVTGCETPERLADEQNLVPSMPSYLNGSYFDEIYHARTAYENVHRIEPTETSHPPLGKLFIALGTQMFGMTPFGWRFMGNLFGIFMIFAIYLLARRITKKPWFAFIAAFLLTFDFMHFTQTRIATIDSYPVVFILLSYYFMYCFYAGNYQKTGLKQPLLSLLGSGIFFGLACASKWTGIYSGFGLAAIFFLHMAGRLRDYLQAKKQGGAAGKTVAAYGKQTAVILLCCVGFFIVIPCAIYFASYIPFRFIEGHPYTFRELLDYQKSMFSYHNKLQQSHPYASMWYTWPIMYKPMWYYYQDLGAGQISTISCFGNPAVWWVGLIAFFATLFTALKKQDSKAWFLVLALLSQIVPWMPIPRVLFIYHYFASTPFLMIMTAYALQNVYADIKTDKGKRRFYAGAGVYLGVVALLFVLFYPVISGMPVAKEYVAHVLRWFESWVFYL
ncbi:MAG: phospholipid carrier-dependent glycosyltransferase [Clostridia bacterium]|nr:phospholipid carrier-dependent glycosyltransferase [Clostridia bacterium]